MLPMFLFMTAPLWGLLLFVFLPIGVAAPLYLFVAVIGVASHVLMVRAAREPVMTGSEGLIGMTATIVSWNGLTGTVRCRGELWAARSTDSFVPISGRCVRVVGVNHLTLEVIPANPVSD